MKTDSLFYQIFHILPDTLFDLIGQQPHTSAEYQFASVELKQTAFRIDGVLKPSEDAPDKRIYFVEVQFQLDSDIYWRLFSEIFLYLKLEKPASNWQAVVLFAGASLDPGLTQHFEALRKDHLTVLYLDSLKKRKETSPGIEMVQLILAPEAKAVERGKKLLARLREEPGRAVANREIIDLVETILLYKFPQMSREEFEAMFQLEDLKQTRIYRDAVEEGKQEGKQEGEVKGKLDMVPLLVQSGLSVERIARESGLDVEAVRKAAMRGTNGVEGNGQAV